MAQVSKIFRLGSQDLKMTKHQYLFTFRTYGWSFQSFQSFQPLSFQPRSHNEICEALASLTAFEDDTGEAGETAAGLAEEEGMQDSWCDLHLWEIWEINEDQKLQKGDVTACYDGCVCLRKVGVISPVLDVNAKDPVIER